MYLPIACRSTLSCSVSVAGPNRVSKVDFRSRMGGPGIDVLEIEIDKGVQEIGRR